MSLCKSEPHPETIKNLIAPHPWSRIIKDIYSNKIKHAHNSIHNPDYPKGKEGKTSKKQTNPVQFTIIGDLVTKEFIYCANLVKGLHKYRKKLFHAPIIQGVTSVDWPSVCNELKIRFGGLSFCLRSRVAVLIDGKFLGGEKELKELIETKFTYHLCLDYYNESINEFSKFISRSGRPFAYMHIAIDEEHVGTLIFMVRQNPEPYKELYADIVPHTCENFLRLCKETRGGYSGTPVHRIVKDGWIQCGGFGLKETELDCENFIIPHDKRGVLGMANDGRHISCSTQFFVLLQPAVWMARKYVAFGQLIEGESTLKKIEEVPTWYESPTSVITIYKSGIFNMDCHNITINKGTYEYIQGHIEDLNAFGELLYENLMEKVFLTAQLRELERLREEEGEGESSEKDSEEGASGIHATQRFKKEDIEKELQKTKTGSTVDKSQYSKAQVDSRRPTATSTNQPENNDFDVEEYEFEYEPEEQYSHQSLPPTPSLVVKPEKPYYLPLTDVPYPEETDSNFNLRKFLMGDYCLESDLRKDDEGKKIVTRDKLSYISDMFNFEPQNSNTTSEMSLDSDDEREIRKYLKKHADSVSFAGGIIKTIAKASEKYNLFEDSQRSELITDENLRKLRVASSDLRYRHSKKVSINAPIEEDSDKKIKRRQTGFVRPQDLEKIHVIDKSSTIMVEPDDSTTALERKVRIAPSTMVSQEGLRLQRRPTGYVRAPSFMGSDSDVRQSVLVRLYEEFKEDDEPPTLKDYKPMTETQPQNTLITFSPTSRIKSDESNREKYIRHSLTIEHDSYEQVMTIQHGKKVTRKISSDYVKTIDQIEHRLKSSIRSIEFAKLRPAMSVSEYQMKNKQYQEELKRMSSSNVQSTGKSTSILKNKGGLRLPGDSPLYSMDEMKKSKT